MDAPERLRVRTGSFVWRLRGCECFPTNTICFRSRDEYSAELRRSGFGIAISGQNGSAVCEAGPDGSVMAAAAQACRTSSADAGLFTPGLGCLTGREIAFPPWEDRSSPPASPAGIEPPPRQTLVLISVRRLLSNTSFSCGSDASICGDLSAGRADAHRPGRRDAFKDLAVQNVQNVQNVHFELLETWLLAGLFSWCGFPPGTLVSCRHPNTQTHTCTQVGGACRGLSDDSEALNQPVQVQGWAKAMQVSGLRFKNPSSSRS